MGAIEHLTVRISAEAARKVRMLVESGDYPDASAVMEQALAALDTLDDDIASMMPEHDTDGAAHWLRSEVAAACDEMDRDPSSGIPLEQVVARLKAERHARGE